MSEISKLKIGTATYDVKDAYARQLLDDLGTAAAKDYEDILTNSGNLPTGAAITAYVAGEIAKVPKFDVVIDPDGTSEGPSVMASEITMYKIYLVPSAIAVGSYVEWITIRSGEEGSYAYTWEQIGSTSTDLSNYVQKSTTIAGITLDHNITVAELEDEDALDLKALSHKDTAEGNYIKATGIEDIEYTPAGEVEVTLTQTSTEINSAGNYTPAGTVSVPTITVTPETSTVVGSVATAGEVPTFTEGAFTAATLDYDETNFATNGCVISIDATDPEMLVINDATLVSGAVINSFDGGSKAADTWDAGSMPTFSNATVVSGIASATSTQPEFTGTNSIVEVSGYYDKAEVNDTVFEGSTAILSTTITTETDIITVE